MCYYEVTKLKEVFLNEKDTKLVFIRVNAFEHYGRV